VVKAIASLEALKTAFIQAQSESSNGKVFVENDLRAFCNPTRQKMIEQVTHDMVEKLLSLHPPIEDPGALNAKKVSTKSSKPVAT